MCFAHLGIDLEFSGTGLNEIARVKSCNNDNYKLDRGKIVLSIDSKYFRPTEVDLLKGDSSKAKEKLGWEPLISLEELIIDMMDSDIKLMQKENYLKKGGFKTLNYFE
jgi:GDPmannose 4,6-dehydratase